MRTTVRVLIVDDDARFVEALSYLIGKHPYLSVAATARDDLQVSRMMFFELGEPLFDAALVDYRLADGFDGTEVVRTIKTTLPACVVVGLTGETDVEIHQRMLDAGAEAVMVKSEILDGIARAVGGLDLVGVLAAGALESGVVEQLRLHR